MPDADAAIHCGCQLESYSVLDGEDEVELRFADGTTVRCAMCIGADGAGSAVRRQLAGESESRTNGQLLWNALLPSGAVDAHGDSCVNFYTCGSDGQAILAFDAGEGNILPWLVDEYTRCANLPPIFN